MIPAKFTTLLMKMQVKCKKIKNNKEILISLCFGLLYLNCWWELLQAHFEDGEERKGREKNLLLLSKGKLPKFL